MLQSFMLVIALSIDSFLAALAYGAEKIKIPLRSAILIASIGVLFLSISLFTASFIQQFLPQIVCQWISFTIFFIIGISSLFQGAIKKFLADCKRKKLSFQYSGISFVLDVYIDETKADSDHSKSLSMKEAMYLAIALSIDSLVSGFALGIGITNPLVVLGISFFIGVSSIFLGSYLGRRMLKTTKFDLSWVSGLMFIVLAITRII